MWLQLNHADRRQTLYHPLYFLDMSGLVICAIGMTQFPIKSIAADITIPYLDAIECDSEAREEMHVDWAALRRVIYWSNIDASFDNRNV